MKSLKERKNAEKQTGDCEAMTLKKSAVDLSTYTREV